MYTCNGMPDIRNERRPIRKGVLWAVLLSVILFMTVGIVMAGIEVDYRNPSVVSPTLDNIPRIHKALALVVLDEQNNTRQWLESFKAEVAASVSLADLKTRVAALPNMPDRTPAQLRDAVTAKYKALNP